MVSQIGGCQWANDSLLCARLTTPGTASDSPKAAPTYPCSVRYATRLRSPSRRRSYRKDARSRLGMVVTTDRSAPCVGS